MPSGWKVSVSDEDGARQAEAEQFSVISWQFSVKRRRTRQSGIFGVRRPGCRFFCVGTLCQLQKRELSSPTPHRDIFVRAQPQSGGKPPHSKLSRSLHLAARREGLRGRVYARDSTYNLRIELKCGLEFGVSVRADFAVEIDFFVLRGGPFHR
jgi:hypothetical protein